MFCYSPDRDTFCVPWVLLYYSFPARELLLLCVSVLVILILALNGKVFPLPENSIGSSLLQDG